MAWIRRKKYLVEVLAPHGSAIGIMVHGVLYGEHAFFDWISRRFVQDQPAQLVQPIAEQVIPSIDGPIQRFCYLLDTNDFPDGDFALLYTDGSGKLLPGSSPEFFCIFGGSPNEVLPADA